MKKCLIYLERQYERFCVDLLKAAEEIYGNGYVSYALSDGADTSLARGGFDHIIQTESCADVYVLTGVIEEIHRQEGFDSILILATHFGRMIAPAVAMRLRTGLVADITKIGHYCGQVEMIRPAYSGKILAGIINIREGVAMMSVRPGVFLYEETKTKKTAIHEFVPKNRRRPKAELVLRNEKPETKDIRDSEILVSGGGGILDDFDVIDGLAERLGGMKSASRRVVDSGKADRSIQVGQSGKIVNPKLYIALGIYGALQHVAGLNRVKHLIAVNTNKNSPICSLADIVVEGDARTFVENLIKRIDCEA